MKNVYLFIEIYIYLWKFIFKMSIKSNVDFTFVFIVHNKKKYDKYISKIYLENI